MTPEQEKQVEEIRKRHEISERLKIDIYDEPSKRVEHNANQRQKDRGALLAILDDLRKQLNAYSLLSEAVGSVTSTNKAG